MLYVLLLTGFSLMIISCGKKDSTSSTTSTETTTSVSYVSVGTNGTILTSSDNGTTWTSRTSGTSNGLQRVIYANSTFVTVGNSGTILTYHKPFRITTNRSELFSPILFPRHVRWVYRSMDKKIKR